MQHRAKPSGIKLEAKDVEQIKGMLLRGDRQHDIAAWFGVNGGRIAEIAAGNNYGELLAAPSSSLPPSGPYPRAQDALAAIHALSVAKKALVQAEESMKRYSV